LETLWGPFPTTPIPGKEDGKETATKPCLIGVVYAVWVLIGFVIVETDDEWGKVDVTTIEVTTGEGC